MGQSLLTTGDIAEGRMHFDSARAFYDPAAHRQLATRFGQDLRVAILSYRSFALWMLGYPEAALADTEHALKDAREIGHAATLMYTLANAQYTHILCGNNEIAKTLSDELIALSDEKGSLSWKSMGMMQRGLLFAVTGNASDAVQMITSGLAAYRLTGSTWSIPTFLTYLASVYAELGQFDGSIEAMRALDFDGHHILAARPRQSRQEGATQPSQAKIRNGDLHHSTETPVLVPC